MVRGEQEQRSMRCTWRRTTATPPHHHKGTPSWVLHLWLQKEQGDITNAGRRKLLADAASLDQGAALHMLQRETGDSGGPRVALEELWAQSCWRAQEWLWRSCGHRDAGGSRQQRPATRRTQKKKARGDTKKGRLVKQLCRAAPAAQALWLAALAGCWSSSRCWIRPKEQGLKLLSSSAAHGQPSWAGTATHRCAKALCSAVG